MLTILQHVCVEASLVKVAQRVSHTRSVQYVNWKIVDRISCLGFCFPPAFPPGFYHRIDTFPLYYIYIYLRLGLISKRSY